MEQGKLFDVPVDPTMDVLLHKETTPTGMRALSWKQPYASLMLHGKIETRRWSTQYRGPVLICASKQPYFEWILKPMLGRLYDRVKELLGDFDLLPKGKAIAVGNLVDCRRMTEEDEDKCFVMFDSTPGLWCHIYEDVRPIEPFDWKGAQGWRTLNEEQKSKIKFLQTNQ